MAKLDFTAKFMGTSQEGKGVNAREFLDFDIKIENYPYTCFSVSVPVKGGTWRYSKTFLNNLTAEEQDQIIEAIHKMI